MPSGSNGNNDDDAAIVVKVGVAGRGMAIIGRIHDPRW
jgi:hypothetical protein